MSEDERLICICNNNIYNVSQIDHQMGNQRCNIPYLILIAFLKVVICDHVFVSDGLMATCSTSR